MILPLEQQVCSLQSAKRLKELNCTQESLFYWGHKDNSWFVYGSYWNGKPSFNGIYSAYTVAELGELLPYEIIHPKLKYAVGVLTILKPKSNWFIGYGREGMSVFPQDVANPNEAEARAKMLIYLHENNLIEFKGRNGDGK